MPQAKPCKLALADGLVLTGESFGATGNSQGEVVFNTSMSGYQEVLTEVFVRLELVPSKQVLHLRYCRLAAHGRPRSLLCYHGRNAYDPGRSNARKRTEGFLAKGMTRW